MIGIDTNIIIRYLTQDDPIQANLANKLIEEELNQSNPGFITLISLIEISWVLKRCYSQTKDQIINVIAQLLETRQLLIENQECAYLALKKFSSGNADYADSLITVLSEQAGCNKIVTFDKKAKSVGMKILS